MQRSESGVSEIVSTVLVVLLVIALAAIMGAIFLGWAVPVQKTPYIVTQATPTTITNASVIRLFMSQGETASLAPATGPGLPVKFSLTNGSATYHFVPLPGAASNGWMPGDTLILFRNATGSWVADSTAPVKNNTGFSNGTWTVNIVDATSNVLVAQHTVNLTGGGAPVVYPVYPGFTVEAWIKWVKKPSIPVPTNQMWATLVLDGSSNNNRRYHIQHDQNNTKFEFAIGTANMSDSGKWVQSTTNPVNGSWYLVTGVYNQTLGKMAIYVNGNQEGSWVTADRSGLRGIPGTPQIGGIQTGYPNGKGICFAGSTNCADNTRTRLLNGYVTGVQYFDYVKSPTEILAYYNAGGHPA